jgi:hypothetical protein
MENNQPTKVEGGENCQSFITIDDLTHLAQELLNGLNRLGEYKYPLDVRKGKKEVTNMLDQNGRSKTIKAGSKTYFFDIKETKEKNPYLVITESRFKTDAGNRARKTLVVFSEHIKEFADTVAEMAIRIAY